ncbi:MAG TPA: hypothetical protein VJ865_14730 [Gemmatimonadaceae bacterium]|nr:hypothetical protein [Gemmatimonadaceae bacterium]
MTGAPDVDMNIFQWAVQVGGPMAGLLLVFGYFYRKDMKDSAEKAAATQKANTEQYREDMRFYTDQMKIVSDEWKGQSAQLMAIVKENTAAFTQNTAVVQSLHSHIAEGERRNQERLNQDRLLRGARPE